MNRTKQGVLKSWHPLRGFGTVVVTRHEAYFLHTSNVVEGPENPALGSIVHFDPAPAINNGKLPQAVNAIVEPADGLEVLGGAK
jgi:hypothetical protein